MKLADLLAIIDLDTEVSLRISGSYICSKAPTLKMILIDELQNAEVLEMSCADDIIRIWIKEIE